MKKAFLAIATFTALVSSAQKVSNKLTFSKGQKLEVVTNTNVQAESMMGPASGTISFADVYAVNDITENAASLTRTPKHVKIAFRSGSQEMKLDSDNPKDLSGPLGDPVKEIMSLKPEFTIDAAGKVMSVKKDEKKKEDVAEGGMLAMLMPGMNMATARPKEGNASIFQVLPNREVGVGDTWTDSVEADGNKSVTFYKVKEITDKEVVLDFQATGSSVSTQSMMGQTIKMNGSTKGTGSVILDKTTGIIKQKTITSTSETAMNFGGQEITTTGKTTSVMNVNML